MKNLARFAPVAAVLGTILILAGCATPRSARVTRAQPVAEFTVVESSTSKELTPAQLDDLREAVANYLHEQGLADKRVYYVKVTFPGESPDDEVQWAIVRIGNLPARTYTILAAYPGPDDYYPYDYYAYNAGFDGFARYGYYDPFDYDYGYYTRPAPRRDHQPDDRPGDRPDHPRTTPTGWDNNKHPDPDQPPRDRPRLPPPPGTRNHDRSDNPPTRTWTRDHSDDRGRDTGGTRDWGRDSSGGRSSSAAPSYTPPPAPVRSDPPRNESPSPMQSSRDKSDPPTNEK